MEGLGGDGRRGEREGEVGEERVGLEMAWVWVRGGNWSCKKTREREEETIFSDFEGEEKEQKEEGEKEEKKKSLTPNRVNVLGVRTAKLDPLSLRINYSLFLRRRSILPRTKDFERAGSSVVKVEEDGVEDCWRGNFGR